MLSLDLITLGLEWSQKHISQRFTLKGFVQYYFFNLDAPLGFCRPDTSNLVLSLVVTIAVVRTRPPLENLQVEHSAICNVNVHSVYSD